jgi:hypothetical protein
MGIFKNKTVQIILGILLIAALGVTGYFIIAGRSTSKIVKEEKESADVVHQLSAEALGLSLEANSAKNEVKFVIEKASDIASIEYQLMYEADSTAAERREGGEPRVQRGITGEETIKSGQSSYESTWLVLGSESAGVVRYDKGVSSVKLTLKIIKTDGKIYEVEKSLEL